MCDCYSPKCEICDERIPVHIGDYNYPREDVQVFCRLHIPGRKVTVFTSTEKSRMDPEYPKGWSCGIRLQDGRTEPSSEDVTPNIGVEYIVEQRT